MKCHSVLVFILISTILLSSCDKNRIYEKNITINNYVWKSDFNATYKVEIKDTTVIYDLYVNVRHAEIYPYQNLWLLINTQSPDGTKSNKRIEITLANEEGKWYGEGLGDIWDYRTLIQENAFFNSPGTYTFSIQHNMRQDPLPGIMAIGLRVEDTGKLRKSLQ